MTEYKTPFEIRDVIRDNPEQILADAIDCELACDCFERRGEFFCCLRVHSSPVSFTILGGFDALTLTTWSYENGGGEKSVSLFAEEVKALRDAAAAMGVLEVFD